MSKIDKLSILGIRSYAPDEPQIIDFYTPLTLIIGQNGCGKTTIIESLMYATAGSLPSGASKGGAFIYDPKIAGETSVKAQIRLRFNDIQARRFTMTRNLQASQTKKGISMKTLEALLQVETPEGKQSITQKCADVNLETQQRLGVSKAVLENVIFCHQEESNWPLSEASALKKKFDDIFNATEYAKMVKLLVDLRKKMESELKTCKTELKYLSNDKNSSVEKKIQMAEISEKIIKYKTEIGELEATLNVKNREMDQLVETTKEWQSIEVTLKEWKSKRDHMQQNVNELENQIHQMPVESNEELELLLEQQREGLITARASMEQLQNQIQQLESESIQKSKNKDNLINNIGKLQQRKEQLNSKLTEMDRLLKSYKMSTQQQCNLQLQQKSSELKTNLKLLNDNFEVKKQDKEFKIQNLSNKISQQQANNQNYDRNIHQLKIQIQRYSDDIKKIEALDQDYGSLISTEQSKLHELNTRIVNLQRDLENAEQNNGNHSRDLERLEKRRDIAINRKIISKELTQYREQLQEIETQTKLYYDDCVTRLSGVITYIDDFNDIKMNLQLKQTQVQQDYEDKQNKCRDLQNDIYGLKAKMEVVKTKIEQYNKNKDELRDKLNNICAIENFESTLQDAQQKFDNANGSSALIPLYKEYLSQAVEARSCSLCRRSFSSKEEKKLKDFISSLKKDSEMLNMGESAVIEAKEKLIDLRALKSLHDVISRGIYEELQDESEIKVKLQLKEENYKDFESQFEKIKNTLTLINSSLSSNQEIAQLNNHSLNSKILTAQQELLQLQESSTVSELDQEKAKLSKEIQFQNEKKHQLNLEIRKLDQEKFSVDKKIVSYNEKLQHYKESRSKLQEYEQYKLKDTSQINELIKSKSSLEDEIKVIQDELKQTKTNLNHIQNEYNETRSNTEHEISVCADKISTFSRLDVEIQNLKNVNSEKEMHKLNNELGKINSEIQHINEQISTMKQDYNTQDAMELTSKAFERHVEDVFKYRKWKEEIKSLSIKISEKQSNIGDIRIYSTQQNDLKTQITNFTKQIASLTGQLKQLDDRRKDLSKELAEKYKDAALKHHTALVDKVTGELAIHDLQVYATALDQAIMQYHKEKMKLVNNIIRDLWVETYQGNDIDTIEIRTELETKGNKSYNYRVCMVKGDVSIDMRGRCSAGQKVLSCIIIRLALAEVFGTNCGILALDEPTTNLDRRNIEALATSLCKIIETRRKQSNFQLIVITHDEQFLNILGKREFIDNYYKISKNINQCSVIRKIAAD
eukprot:NODE_78_length_23230_cov_1.644979.p2 type:complete len:1268 gc:universal NODE_78_length_23230_cov_1.644979:8604-4801(-)